MEVKTDWKLSEYRSRYSWVSFEPWHRMIVERDTWGDEYARPDSGIEREHSLLTVREQRQSGVLEPPSGNDRQRLAGLLRSPLIVATLLNAAREADSAAMTERGD